MLEVWSGGNRCGTIFRGDGATVLELADLKTRTVEIEGERLSCECVGTLNRAAISRIGMLTPWLPEPVRHIRIEVCADESVHIMEGPAEPLRVFDKRRPLGACRRLPCHLQRCRQVRL